MSKILVIKPPVTWTADMVGGDEQMFYRIFNGLVEARTVALEWREIAMTHLYTDLEGVETFYVDPNSAEPWRAEYITEGELDAFLRAG